jgi:hypothetical protein
MTNKIPVGATIARAYGFAFGNILNNLGAIWIPLAILYGLFFVFYGRYMDAMMAFMSHDLEAIQRALPYFFGMYAVLFVLLTAQIAALTKEALGLRKGSAWLQFPFGMGMWRLLIGYIALFFVAILLEIALFLAGFVGGAIGGVIAKLVAGHYALVAISAVTAVVMIAVFCAFIYCMVRLSFLLAPAAVEGPRALRRGWALTRGNFWRIFTIWLAAIIPLFVLEFVFLHFMVGFHFFPPHMNAMSPQDAMQWQQQQMGAVRQIMEKTRSLWYIAFPIGVVVSVILYGLMAGISAFAYRALVPEGTALPDA